MQSSYRLDDLQSERNAINSMVSFVDSEGVRTVWWGWQPLLSYPMDDDLSERFVIVLLARHKAATMTELARGLDVHLNTVRRWVDRFESERIAGLIDDKRGPRGPHKLTPAIERDLRAWCLSDRPIGKELAAHIEQQYGIRLHPEYLRRWWKNHRATAPVVVSKPLRPVEQLNWSLEMAPAVQPLTTGSEQAQTVDNTGAADPGLAVAFSSAAPAVSEPAVLPVTVGTDMAEPRAAIGEPSNPEAEVFTRPVPVASRSDLQYLSALREGIHTPFAGALLVVPFLQQLGLQGLVTGILGQLTRSRWFNTWEVWLTGVFMSLLGYHSWESFKTVSRRLWGVLVGRRRGPTVRTLRAKVAALAAGQAGAHLVGALARNFMEAGRVAVGVLYYDGHFRPYYGKKKLAKGYYTQRRMPVPGSSSYFANDGQGRPLFFLLAEANCSLGRMLPTLIAKTREIIGDQLFTVVFDRGGYSAAVFTALQEFKIPFITYAVKLQVEISEDAFSLIQVRYRHCAVHYGVWEGTHTVKGFGVLRLVVVKKGAKQTPILTNDWNRPAAEVVELLLNRWSQENFFKTMVHEYGLNAVGFYETALPDQQAEVPNPAHRALTATLKEMAREQRRLGEALGRVYAQKGQSTVSTDLAQQLNELQARRKELLKQRRSTPATVAASEAGEVNQVLSFERRTLHDAMRMCAYTLNEALLEQFALHYQNWNDIRQVMRSLVRSKGFLRLDGEFLTVRLTAPESPRYGEAFRQLCDCLNRMNPVTPDRFQLPIRFKVH